MKDKIVLNFEEFSLGELSFDGKNYIYNSYYDKELDASVKYTIMLTYPLKNSQNLKSETLFNVFKTILQDCQREDIIKECKILQTDSDFEKLLKIAKTPFAKHTYYLTIKR